jgi:ribonuclease H2 subunit C
MLAIKKSESTTPSCAVNVLPCRIQHNGPVNATTRHWTPEVSADGKSNTAYFRGRKLNGKVVNLPDGYRGRLFLQCFIIHPLLYIKPYLLLFNTCKQEKQQGKEKEANHVFCP